MKILHSADWHLCSPLQGRSEVQTQLLRKNLLQIPGKVAALCRAEGCDMMLLAGDLFDGPFDADTFRILCDALEEAAVPVFITPGNHDFADMRSPWLTQKFPENVHIFTRPVIEAVDVPSLNCRVYGAGFTAMDCPALLDNFCADADKLAIGILHGDPTVAASPYNPISQAQVAQSNLAYLALGHIHKGGSFRAGGTLCAWPGCPMGRGFDELGEKGVIITVLGEQAETRFLPLDTPRFFDEELSAGDDVAAALAAVLPAIDSRDFYRITLTGYSSEIDIPALAQQFSHVPNLILRDQTLPEPDLWMNTDEDTLEGLMFSQFKELADTSGEPLSQQALLAARICRSILDGQEVVLP